MKIKYELLEDEEPMDSESLVGTFEILEEVEGIRVEMTYVDSWFDSLLEGVHRLELEGQNRVVVDILKSLYHWSWMLRASLGFRSLLAKTVSTSE